ncbi:MAG: glycosyltransferase family 4 protein [Sodaliphilus sp.]
MIQYKKKIIRAVTVAQSIGFFVEMIPTLNQKEIEVVALSSPGKELDDLREKGVPTIIVPIERHIAIFKDVKALIALVKVFRREKPDMVHSMTPKAGLLCMLAAKMAHVPVRVHTFTGLVWPTAKGLKRCILMLTDWLTCACATHVIPEGEGVKADLQRHITRKPMRVLGYGNAKGVDMERFSLRPEIEDAAKDLSSRNLFTFLYVGRIVSDKGVNELVDAFARLHALNPHCRLVLVGKMEENLDPLKPSTLKKILALKGIQAVGEKRGDELIAWYAASDCFVLPSYREGFPNTVLEAGAMGLPSIVTDINGSREIVENGKNGVIIPPKDADALLEAMQHMLDDESERKSIASAARPMIASRFEKSYVQQCLLDFYREIL